MQSGSRGILWAVVLSGITAASFSWGQAEPTPTQTTLAESLFRDGQTLMAAGRYEEACPKLAESYRLDPAGGTVLNLAVCHERQGRVAAAWAEYRDALIYASREGRQDREQLARTRIAALEPTLPRLLVKVPATSSTTGLVVAIDGVDIGPAAWGTELPLDPGGHLLTVTAPGRQDFQRSISLRLSEKLEVSIPELEPVVRDDEAPKARQPVTRDGDEDPHAGRRTAGYVVAGGGLVALGVGSWFGIRAFSDRSRSDARCNPLCDDEAVRLNDDAKRDARVADVGIGLGVVGIAAGAYLILATPQAARPAYNRVSSRSGAWQLTPHVTRRRVWLALDSSW